MVVVDPRRTETARQYEHVADPSRHGCVAAALDAAGHLRRGARGPRLVWTRRAGAARRWPSACATSRPSARRGSPACPPQTRARAGAGVRRRAGRRRLRAHRLVPGPLRDARRLPAGCAERRHREPGPPRRCGLRAAADRAGRGRREGGARHLRQGALAVRRLPRRDRQPAGDADPEGDHDPGRAADPRVLRVRRATRCCPCPTATRSRRRSRSSTCWCRSTST